MYLLYFYDVLLTNYNILYNNTYLVQFIINIFDTQLYCVLTFYINIVYKFSVDKMLYFIIYMFCTFFTWKYKIVKTLYMEIMLFLHHNTFYMIIYVKCVYNNQNNMFNQFAFFLDYSTRMFSIAFLNGHTPILFRNFCSPILPN